MPIADLEAIAIIEEPFAEMKQITISMSDAHYRPALIHAVRKNTTVAGLVKMFRASLVEDRTEFERLKRKEREIRESIHAFCASERLSREEVHARNPFC